MGFAVVLWSPLKLCLFGPKANDLLWEDLWEKSLCLRLGERVCKLSCSLCTKDGTWLRLVETGLYSVPHGETPVSAPSISNDKTRVGNDRVGKKGGIVLHIGEGRLEA